MIQSLCGSSSENFRGTWEDRLLDCLYWHDQCKLRYNGKDHHTFLKFTKTGLDENVNIPLPFSKCQLRILAVGGGGIGGQWRDGGWGGGSGYIQYRKLTLTAESVINLRVGKGSQSSVVTINGQTIEAAPGKSSLAKGGDGYSGGGADGYSGGSNGGNGDDPWYRSDDGHGTGEDITTYRMDNFVLSPGAGGKVWYSGDHFKYSDIYYGGGGGGVLVNGQGPHRDSYDNQGEGYGGGGGGRYREGLPGVILIEIF